MRCFRGCQRAGRGPGWFVASSGKIQRAPGEVYRAVRVLHMALRNGIRFGVASPSGGRGAAAARSPAAA